MSLSQGFEASAVLAGEAATQGVSINKLSNARTSKVCMVCFHSHCPKELERGRAAHGLCMTFIQLLGYLHLAMVPFAARGLSEPHREKQKARIRA